MKFFEIHDSDLKRQVFFAIGQITSVKADPKRPDKFTEIGTSCGTVFHVYGNVLQVTNDIRERS